MCVWGGFWVWSGCWVPYHGQVFEDLDPVSWSHVGHVVKVSGVGDQLVPHLWVSQHFSGPKHTEDMKNRGGTGVGRRPPRGLGPSDTRRR